MSGNPNKKLFLLDAMALIYRAYFAMIRNPLTNSKGVNTSAISGFTNTLLDLINRDNPTHIAVVFDTFAPTSRSEEFAEYKANRQETPKDIKSAIAPIKEIVKALRIPVIELDGYEADDIIGTLATKAGELGYTTYMVTPDKDFGQLVNAYTFMYKPAKGGGFEKVEAADVLEKWGLQETSQVIDLLGLMGDAVDNIPGVPGVGEKTAVKLLQEYGTMETMLERADEIKGKLGERIRENKEQALLSRKLATIIIDAPIPFEEDKLLREKPDKKRLAELFTEFEFRTLGKRLLGDDFGAGGSEASGQISMFAETNEAADGYRHLETAKHAYTVLDAPPEDWSTLIAPGKVLGIEFLGTSPDGMMAKPVGIAISWKPGEAVYLRLPPGQAAAPLQTLKPILEDKKTTKAGHDLKRQILMLRRFGIELGGDLLDSQLAQFLIDPEIGRRLDILSESYLSYHPINREKLFRRKTDHNYREADSTMVSQYACEAADINAQLFPKLAAALKEREAWELYQNIELPLLRVLADVEGEGVSVDTGFLDAYGQELGAQIAALQKEIHETAGTAFNIDSPRQLGRILFEELELPYYGKKTKTGQKSTNEEVLSRLSEEFDIARKVLEYRELTKLKSTYVDALPLLVHPETQRIHTTFAQAVAATGRLSSNNPNLQNIPIRTAAGREIRKAFVPSEGHVLLSADYSQIELRIIAALAQDEAMLDAFAKGLDIHTATAARVYGLDVEEVSQEMRRNAKMVNFGIIYGISAFGLSQRLNIPRKEGAALIENYFAKYPAIKAYMDKSIETAREQGYVTTICGRRRYLPDIHSRNHTVRSFAERNAINSPIQGSAADLIKVAMVNISRRFEREGVASRMILQVHDELLFDVVPVEEAAVKELVQTEMENALELPVPLAVEVGRGTNWLEAH